MKKNWNQDKDDGWNFDNSEYKFKYVADWANEEEQQTKFLIAEHRKGKFIQNCC